MAFILFSISEENDFIVNSDTISSVGVEELNKLAIITFTNGHQFILKEGIEDVKAKLGLGDPPPRRPARVHI